MTDTRIIFTHGGGRLANQLISHAHLLAFCMEHKGTFSLFNAALWPWREQLKYTVGFDGAAGPKWPAQLCQSLLQVRAGKSGHWSALRITYRAASYLPDTACTQTAEIAAVQPVCARIVPNIDLASSADTALLERAPTHLLGGWAIRSWPLVAQRRHDVLDRMRPAPAIAESAARLVTLARADCDMLIGVHVRRGDYRTYRNGQFFYEPSQYVRWMHQMRERHAHRGRVGFLVCSDENLTQTDFQGLQVRTAWDFESILPPLRDNAALAMCDLLIAPPSTFALWAAFSGGIPMLALTSAAQDAGSEPFIRDSFFDWLTHPLSTEFSP